MRLSRNVIAHPAAYNMFKERLCRAVDCIDASSEEELLAILMGIIEVGINGGAFDVHQVKDILVGICDEKIKRMADSAV